MFTFMNSCRRFVTEDVILLIRTTIALSLSWSSTCAASSCACALSSWEWSDSPQSINRPTIKTTVCNGSQNVYSLLPFPPASPPSLSAPQFVKTEQNVAPITRDQQTIFNSQHHDTPYPPSYTHKLHKVILSATDKSPVVSMHQVPTCLMCAACWAAMPSMADLDSEMCQQ